jgi:DNA-binding CsgD family transcriptional regulator
MRHLSHDGLPRQLREVLMGGPRNDADTRSRSILTILLAGIAAAGLVDLYLDRPVPPWGFHRFFEILVLALSLGAVGYLWSGWMTARGEMSDIRKALEARKRERDEWRGRAEKLLTGLGEEIDAQLRRWALTPAERETALFLLKGFEHKEIAALLGKSERTVREQAVAVYRKSGLQGRAHLSAFFLEDLLFPPEEAKDQEGT